MHPLAPLALSLAALPALANPAIRWHSVDAGAASSSAGNLRLTGTIGQHDAGRLASTSFRVSGGFWNAALSGPACPGQGGGACGPGDWNQDGVIDFNDLLAFLNDYNALAPCADLNADASVDFNDLLEYLNLFNAGC